MRLWGWNCVGRVIVICRNNLQTHLTNVAKNYKIRVIIYIRTETVRLSLMYIVNCGRGINGGTGIRLNGVVPYTFQCKKCDPLGRYKCEINIICNVPRYDAKCQILKP
jgi:hypothetical protein